MRICKEELSSIALAVFILVMIAGSVEKFVIAGQEWTSRRNHPLFVAVLGMFCLGYAAYTLSKGSFGDGERNGRVERPFVYWPLFLTLVVAGAGSILVGFYSLLK